MNNSIWYSKHISCLPNKRLLIFSDEYRNDNNGMKFRIIDSEFLNILTDVTCWCYLKEPKSIIDMSEIIKPLIKLTEGIPYNPSSSEEYVITLDNSLSDILRFAIDQSDIEEIETLINVIKQERK